jgi:hypothetical protein
MSKSTSATSAATTATPAETASAASTPAAVTPVTLPAAPPATIDTAGESAGVLSARLPSSTLTSATGLSPILVARFLAPPPAPDPNFVPPAGFVADNTMDFRGVLPRTAELVALPAAVADLKKFTDYPSVMGSKAPPWAQVIAAFDVTNQWSSARTQADAWDQYARTQEGVSWTMLRALMAQMAPIYEVAVGSDPTMASTLPSLTTLLGVKKTIARKAVSTRKANAKDKAEGKQPTHGKVGKRATKAAEKAALAEKEAAGSAPAVQAAAAQAQAPATQVATVTTAQPATTAATQAPVAAPVATQTPVATNGVANGAGTAAH